MTCGLWFSLGHSTIVVAVICAIAISLGVVDRLGTISSVGGIVGAAVSGSTLFLFAVVNSILLFQSVRASRRCECSQSTAAVSNKVQSPNELDQKEASQALPDTEADQDGRVKDHRFRGIFTRLAYPLFRLVDRPYKLYPIGILFGLGFDTASSIALLGIAGATNTQVQDTDLGSGQAIVSGNDADRSDAAIILLALLFTAGMTLVDSLDSVLMINAYAPGELLAPPTKPSEEANQQRFAWIKRFRFFEDGPADSHPLQLQDQADIKDAPEKDGIKDEVALPIIGGAPLPSSTINQREQAPDEKEHVRDFEEEPIRNGGSTSTSLSHLLTLLSILLAFAISTITLIGLIGENCARCKRAAAKQEDTHDGGLEGRWWLFWQQANDASGIIGACIVGSFAAILALWYACRALLRRYHWTVSRSAG